jgi:hypothetical protein
MRFKSEVLMFLRAERSARTVPSNSGNARMALTNFSASSPLGLNRGSSLCMVVFLGGSVVRVIGTVDAVLRYGGWLKNDEGQRLHNLCPTDPQTRRRSRFVCPWYVGLNKNAPLSLVSTSTGRSTLASEKDDSSSLRLGCAPRNPEAETSI